MNVVVLIIGLLSCATMAAVVRCHFSGMTWSREARITRIISDIGMIAFAWLTWREHHATAGLMISLPLFAACLALLFWAAHTTRSLRLRVAFDPAAPSSVMRTGPYRFVRHPFYTSYIPCWFACAVATLHPLSIGLLVIVAAINVTAARREERGLCGLNLRRRVSRLSPDHRNVLAAP